jgi:hypothetical protein
MRKIYIDCGTHLGEGIKKHTESYGIDETWEIFTFEANKYTFDLLQKIIKDNVPEKYNWTKWGNITYKNAAIWISDGEIDFYCSMPDNHKLAQDRGYAKFMELHDKLVESGDLITRHQRQDFPVDGSSTIIPDHLKAGLQNTGDALQKSLRWDSKIRVECFDFSKWLENNFSIDDYIICKMDIEGAEFEVLKKCIADGTLKLLDMLDIEFHHFNNKQYYKDYKFIMKELKRSGIKFNAW